MSDADRAGFQARSPEGHAAKSMHIKGQEEVWIRIQADTFKNWVNQTLKEGSRSSKGWSSHSKSAADLADIENLETDFSDGTRLCALVEVLQKRKLKHNKRPLNQHHELENISIALDAIQEDGIKLVNIGKQLSFEADNRKKHAAIYNCIPCYLVMDKLSNTVLNAHI